MRTGAIFARGSCRALKWMALLGVVFALGAGSAAAQITSQVAETVTEGNTATITFSADVTVPAASDGDTPTPASSATITLTVVAKGTDYDTTNAIATDVTTQDPGDVIVTTATLNFPENRDPDNPLETTVTGTALVQANQEQGSNAEAEDEIVQLTYALSAIEDAGGTAVSVLDQADTPGALTAPAADVITIEDDDPQDYRLTVTTTDPKEGSAVIATLVADPAHNDHSAAVMVELDPMGNTDYTLRVTATPESAVTGNTVTIGNGGATQATVDITTPTNDMNRNPDNIVVTASVVIDGVREVKHTEPISVADLHTLPAGDKITVKAYDMMTGGVVVDEVVAGGMVYLEVEVDRGGRRGWVGRLSCWRLFR